MIDLLLDAAAVHRLTRLVTADALTAPYRNALIAGAYRRAGRDDESDDWTEYVLADESAPRTAIVWACSKCASVWLAAGVVAARRFAPRAWAPVATALAFSAASGLLGRGESL